MRRKICTLLIVIISIFNIINVNASTNVRERTNDNLLVPGNIEVTDSNRDKILSTPAVDASEKIYDFADLYTESEETNLFNEVNSYISNTGMDLAIVTINFNNKTNAQNYADDFYDYNEFGLGVNRSGVLFLIDMDTREIYMGTTGTAISKYSDDTIDNILDSVYKYMSDEEYFTGTEKFISYAESYSKMSSSDSKKYVINSKGEVVRDNGDYFALFIGSSVITIIALLIMASLNHMVQVATSSIVYLNKETKKVKKTREVFLGSSVSKVRIDTDSGSSHGGSTHSGSSGMSHGGGGHKF